MVTYPGGFCGSSILLIIPTILVQYARKVKAEEKFNEHNAHKAPYGMNWIIVSYVWAALCIFALIIKIVTGQKNEE